MEKNYENIEDFKNVKLVLTTDSEGTITGHLEKIEGYTPPEKKYTSGGRPEDIG